MESQQFTDVDFLVGTEEQRIPAHVVFVAARSQYLRNRIRQAMEARDKHLEKVCTTLIKSMNITLIVITTAIFFCQSGGVKMAPLQKGKCIY